MDLLQFASDRYYKGTIMTPEHIQTVKTVADVGAISLTAASLFDMAPKIAAVFSIVWLAIQIGGWVRKDALPWAIKKYKAHKAK